MYRFDILGVEALRQEWKRGGIKPRSIVGAIADCSTEILTQVEVNVISNWEMADLNSKTNGAFQQAATANREAGRLGVDVNNLHEFVAAARNDDQTMGSNGLLLMKVAPRAPQFGI